MNKMNPDAKKVWLRRIEGQVYGAAYFLIADEIRAVEVTKQVLLCLYEQVGQTECRWPYPGSSEEKKRIFESVFQFIKKKR